MKKLNFLDCFKKYSILIFFVLGLVSYVSHFIVKLMIDMSMILKPTSILLIINEFLGDIGKIFLTSSLFAAVLKSIQFIGIFKEEISKVVTSEEFLGNQSNIKTIWKNATRALYRTDFPEISDKIETIISKKYLPKDEFKYYLENFQVHINVGLNEDGLIELTEETHFQVKMSSSEKEFCHILDYYVYKKSLDDEVTSIELLDLDVKSSYDKVILITKDLTPEIQLDANDLKLNYSYKVIYSGYTEYTSSRTLKFKFYLDADSEHNHISKFFINNMFVQITNSSNLEVSFYPVGTDEFKTIFSNSTGLTKRLDGLIFPEQGYRVFFKHKQIQK